MRNKGYCPFFPMDMLTYFDSGTRENHGYDEVSGRLVNVPIGHHYLVLYSDIQKLRKVYSLYVKGEMQNHPNSVIVVLPYYDSTDRVREVLESNGINVKQSEREGNLVIVDIEVVIKNPNLKGIDTEKLREFSKIIESKAQGRTVFVIADMSIFHHLKKVSELLDYERTLHKDLKVEKWKELCFYNERDFDIMFTKEQSDELLGYHNDRVIKVA
jgi:DcmR-like sensory protein